MVRQLKCGCLLAAVVLSTVNASARQRIENSVVKIVNEFRKFSWYTPWNSGSTGKSTGSGFVISGKRIMTNAHVVSDSALLLVYFHNDPTPYPARVKAIGHDCDLAVIELEDPSRLDAVEPLEFGGLPPIRSRVFTYGYPTGGRLISITAGVVSRIEMQNYVHSGVDQHLAVQTDAAINPGNSGGPVMQGEKVVGVAFQGTQRLENMGFFIPVEVVNHFLSDLADGIYDGFPELGVLAANMLNPAARDYAGMKPGETGVRVDRIVRKSSAEGVLQEGDIITEICGYAVANDGTIDWNGLRLNCLFTVDQHQMGDTITIGIIRGDVRKKLELKLNHYNPNRAMANLYERQPEYYVYAGLVFAPLNRETLKTYGNNWQSDARAELLYEFYFRPIEENDPFDTPHVIQIRRLDDTVNAEESCFLYHIIDSVNGKKVGTLRELIDAFESGTEKNHVIRFKYGNKITVIDREKGDAANLDILRRYGVPKDRNLPD